MFCSGRWGYQYFTTQPIIICIIIIFLKVLEEILLRRT